MKLRIERKTKSAVATVGRLSIDGEDAGFFTLEPPIREEKPRAIPEGVYKVIVDYSQHFECELPHVLDVPGFEGIRIHPGNTSKDTRGCILLGKTWGGANFIGYSRDAFNAVFQKIQAALAQGEEVTLEIA